jgi:hypothetical protein
VRLNFNVLWIDDQPRFVEAQIKAIRTQMEDEGFHFNPTQCTSISDLKKLIAEDVFKDEIDLIMVDWDLGGGVFGQDAIAEIRGSIPYKDIVFYSAHNQVDTLREFAFAKRIEGIYFAVRDDLVTEVLGVFESLVKKVLDLDHTRGIVMGATSDIDQMVNDCLLVMHDQLDPSGQAAGMSEALTKIGERMDEHIGELQALRNTPSLAAMMAAHYIFTANDRLRMLSRWLKHKTFSAHTDARESVHVYMDKVVPKRNRLGHLVLAPEGKPQAVSVGDQQVSLDEMRALRRQILGLRQKFQGLSSALQVGGTNPANRPPAGSGK